MINFIICDDKKESIVEIENQIKSFAKKYNIDAEYHRFTNYGAGFKKIVQDEKTFKVYFIDIEMKDISGMDAIRYIREVYGDWNSIIIIESIHIEEKFSAQNSRLYVFDFLDKNDNFINMLNDDLKKIYKMYKKSSKTMPVIEKEKVEKLEIRDILYIEKNIDSKSCTIYTLYGEKLTKEGINNCKKYLDDDFMMTSRSAIVNLKKIKEYNFKTNTITFIDGSTMSNISRDCRKKLKDYVRNSN